MDVINRSIKATSFSLNRMWIAFVICMAIVAGTFNGIFSYLAVLLSVAVIVFFSEEETLCFLVCIMPFANIFKADAESQSFFTYLILFYVLYNLLKKRKINAAFLISFLCLFAFLAAQMFMSMNVLRSIKFIANLLFIYYAITAKTSENHKNVFLFFILGIALSSSVAALNIIPNLSDYIGAKDLGMTYEELARFAGMYADPNYYAVNVIISLCLIVILNHKKQLGNVPALILACLMVLFSVMTFSKSAFLMLLLPLLMLFYSKIKKRKYFIFAVLIIVGAIFAVNLLAGRIEIFNTVLSRFEASDDVSSLTTSRRDLWMNYIDHLSNSIWTLLFGSGFGAALVGNRAAHNTYLDLLYYLGVVGTILVLIAFFTLIKLKKNPPRKIFLNHCIWLCILAMYFFLSELFYFDWAFHILIAILVSKTDLLHVQEG